MRGFCVCFLDSENKLLNEQSSGPWFDTSWRQFTVLTTCHFQNVVRPQWVNHEKYFENVNCLTTQVTWLSCISILPFKHGNLFTINLVSGILADDKSTESTRPSTSMLHIVDNVRYILNSFKAQWRRMASQTWLTMSQVIACCLMAPSHYLTQSGLLINMLLCDSCRCNLWHKSLLKISLNV